MDRLNRCWRELQRLSPFRDVSRHRDDRIFQNHHDSCCCDDLHGQHGDAWDVLLLRDLRFQWRRKRAEQSCSGGDTSGSAYRPVDDGFKVGKDVSGADFRGFGKKEKSRHSERRFCAKNPSLPFVVNTEGFLAALQREPSARALGMTTKALFPQTLQAVRFSAREKTQTKSAQTEEHVWQLGFQNVSG
jgi:hypothetical protein